MDKWGQQFWDWFIAFDDNSFFWKAQPTYLIVHFLFITGGLVGLVHALRNGGRLPFLWLGIFIHGLVTELVVWAHPEIDNFWHCRTPITFLGKRLPLHILFLYPVFIYNSSIAVSKLNLPKWAEPFAVGLGSVLMDIPYDIVSIRFLHWTWHDTDPNIYDRHYWVPWNSYYFHISFAASFTFWFHATRRWICKNGKWERSSLWKELLCTVISGVLGMPGGILIFLPIYHPLHDIYKIHSEVTFFITFTLFVLIAWSGDREARLTATPRDKILKTSWASWLMIGYQVLHYATFLSFVTFWNPEDEISIGFKEPIGPCDSYRPLHTVLGMELQRRNFLCVTDYDEGYYDFACLPGGKPPANGTEWYTACGIPFKNRAEYISVIGIICTVAATVWYNLHFRSNGDIFNTPKIKANKKAKRN